MSPNKTLRPYRIRLLLLSPLLVAYTLWRGLRDRNWRYIRQRLGFGYPSLDNSIWFHCASVGEFNAALPLISLVAQRNASRDLLVTTNTTSGAATAAREAPAGIVHCYLPLDTGFAVRRFLRATRPHTALILETELWPNLYQMAASRKINLLIVNGRLSKRTVEAPRWMLRAYRQCCENTRTILARSKHDAQQFELLGAGPEKILSLGNIKFAKTSGATRTAQDLVGRRYVLAISTHHDEELQLATAIKSLATSDLLLVLVPRHPHRSAAIIRQFETLDLAVSVRSKHQPVDDSTQVYLADTFGELDDFIAFAAFVVIGGSIISRGGQNILEPARYGRAILCGPHMDNFAEETKLFLQHQAILQIENGASIDTAIAALWSDEPRCRQLGEAAKQLVEARQDIAHDYLKAITPYL